MSEKKKEGLLSRNNSRSPATVTSPSKSATFVETEEFEQIQWNSQETSYPKLSSSEEGSPEAERKINYLPSLHVLDDIQQSLLDFDIRELPATDGQDLDLDSFSPEQPISRTPADREEPVGVLEATRPCDQQNKEKQEMLDAPHSDEYLSFISKIEALIKEWRTFTEKVQPEDVPQALKSNGSRFADRETCDVQQSGRSQKEVVKAEVQSDVSKDSSRDNFKRIQFNIDAISRQLATFKKQALAWPVAKQILEKELEELKDEKFILKVQVSDYREDFAKERDDRTNLAGRLDADKEKYRDIIERLSTEVKKLSDQIQAQTQDQDRRQRHTAISRINFDRRKKAESADLQTQCSRQLVKICELETSEKDLRDRLEAAHKMLKVSKPAPSLDTSNSVAAEEKIRLEGQLTDLKIKEKQLELENQNLQKELEQSQERFDALSIEMDAARREVESINAQFVLKTTQVEHFSSLTKRLQSQVDESNDKLHQAEQEIMKFQQLRKSTEENSVLQAEHFRDLREKMSRACDTRVENLTAHYENERKIFEGSLKRKLQEANDDIESKRQECQELSAAKVDLVQQLYEAHQTAITNGILADKFSVELRSELSELKERDQQRVLKEKNMHGKTIELRNMTASLLSTIKHLNRTLKLHGTQQESIAASKEVSEESLKCFEVKPKTKLSFKDPVGTGAYGSVFVVNLNGTICIGKRLQDILMGRGSKEKVGVSYKEALHAKFCRECYLMSQTKHPNLVKFLGVHFGKDRFDLTLFMEKLESDLEAYIVNNDEVDFKTKLSILNDVSCGLLYLHEECSIIHRDLTAGNILLTSDRTAKIADLGVSRLYNRSLSELSKIPGTLYYMPPEALKDNPTYDKSLDIFSLGVLALYVANQSSPEYSWERVPDAIDARGEAEIYKRKKWIDMMERQQPQLTPLVTWCLADDPLSRPSTFCINILLQEMKSNF